MNTKNQELLDDYFENGLSMDVLVAKHGRSSIQISRLIKQAEAEGRRRCETSRTNRRSILGCEPLSRYHKRIGMKFIRWRCNENKYSPSQAAIVLGVSKNRYAMIEAGTHHFTLLELVFLCEKLGWSLADLMAIAETDDATLFDRKAS